MDTRTSAVVARQLDARRGLRAIERLKAHRAFRVERAGNAAAAAAAAVATAAVSAAATSVRRGADCGGVVGGQVHQGRAALLLHASDGPVRVERAEDGVDAARGRDLHLVLGVAGQDFELLQALLKVGVVRVRPKGSEDGVDELRVAHRAKPVVAGRCEHRRYSSQNGYGV